MPIIRTLQSRAPCSLELKSIALADHSDRLLFRYPGHLNTLTAASAPDTDRILLQAAACIADSSILDLMIEARTVCVRNWPGRSGIRHP